VGIYHPKNGGKPHQHKIKKLKLKIKKIKLKIKKIIFDL
jgi:hypothetical protein